MRNKLCKKKKALHEPGFEPGTPAVLRQCHNQLDHPRYGTDLCALSGLNYLVGPHARSILKCVSLTLISCLRRVSLSLTHIFILILTNLIYILEFKSNRVQLNFSD